MRGFMIALAVLSVLGGSVSAQMSSGRGGGMMGGGWGWGMHPGWLFIIIIVILIILGVAYVMKRK